MQKKNSMAEKCNCSVNQKCDGTTEFPYAFTQKENRLHSKPC